MTDVSFVVIGGGPIGMPTAKYLAMAGESVAVLAPGEPDDERTHPGVFSSHYDQRRLTRVTGRDAAWVEPSRRAMAGYADLERQSGISFHDPVGALLVGADHLPGNYRASLDVARSAQIPHRHHPAGDDSWRSRFGDYDLPETHWLVHEPAPAGVIDPRAMLRAQAAVAERYGASIVAETAVDVRETSAEVVVTTGEGTALRADRVIVAAGAFTNACGLLPEPIPLTVKTEVVVLGEVAAAEADRLSRLPTVSYSIDHPDIADVYLTPAARFEDGRHYVKMGANTAGDRYPTTLDEIRAWFAGGDSQRWCEPLASVLRSIMPTTAFESFTTRRCIVTRTPTGLPTIDRVSGRCFVATGGNGASAKCGDTWGRLAAAMARDRWLDGFDRSDFSVTAARRSPRR